MRRSSALALAATIAAGCAYRPVTPQGPIAPRDLTPPPQEPLRLVLETASGQHIDLADHRGRALLVLAMHTDSIPSQAMVRTLERVARRHPDTVSVVLVAGNEGAPAVLRTLLDAYRDATGIERATLCLASDAVREGASPLGRIERVPVTFFVNRAGVVVRRVESVLSEAQVETMIAPAIPPGG